MNLKSGANLFLALLLFNLILMLNNAVNADPLDNKVEALVFHETPIQDVLRLLATQNDLNLIIGPDSMGTVTLRFSEVTLRSALDAILRAKGFQYTLFDNILVVTTPDSLEKKRGLGLETKMFKLKYVDARDVKSALDSARVLSPWGSVSIYSQSIKEDVRQAERIIRSTTTTTTTQREERPSTRSDVLFVTDRPINLIRAESLIAQLDQEIKQLLIDVHFVEMILDDKQQLGFDWNAILQTEGVFKEKTQWTFGSDAVSAAGRPGGGIIQLGALNTTRFRAVLDALMTDNRANLLSQPRIITLDHQPASISVGETVWKEVISSFDVTGNFQVTFEELEIPIELIVVPHIIHDNRILLDLKPLVKEISGWQALTGGQQLPIISSRSADSRIEVRDGETAIIGGLIKEKVLRDEKRVWLLSSIPLLGKLFKYQKQEKRRTDLTIFITTHIIAQGEQREKYEESKTTLQDEIGFASLQVNESQPVKEEKIIDKAKPEKPLLEKKVGIDMQKYFPLQSNLKWTFSWRGLNEKTWENQMLVSSVANGKAIIAEPYNNGNDALDARSDYAWTLVGLENKFRVAQDSVLYEPYRIIIPRTMAEGEVYENVHTIKRLNKDSKVIESTRIIQQQRYIGLFTVTTFVGRFKDCAAIETVWFEPDRPEKGRLRKVIWYAPEVGPVKVEHDIPWDETALKGNLSGLLVGR